MFSSPASSRHQGAVRRRPSVGRGLRTPPLLLLAPTGEWQDHLILYGGGAAALCLPLITWGLVSENLPIGFAGALLAILGVAASAYLSRLRATVALPVGMVLGIFAARAWWTMASRSPAAGDLMASVIGADASINMAQRMCALLLGLSFWAVRPTVIGFALVPGLAVFGLASGRLEGIIAAGLFCGFIGLSMVVLAWAMLAPEETLGKGPPPPQPSIAPGQASRPGGRPARSWRRKHLLTVGTAFAVCLVLGYSLSLPLIGYSDRRRWHIVIPMISDGPGRPLLSFTPQSAMGRFPVGTAPRPLSDTPVLAVSGEPAQYWRGVVYDQYTGSGWLRWQSDTPVSVADHTVDLSRRFPPPPGAQSRTHEVQVQMDQPFLLYSPGQIQRAVLPRPLPAGRPLQTDPLGRLELLGAMLTTGETYRVVSVPLQETAEPHSSAGEQAPGPLLARPLPPPRHPEEIPQVYLSLPLSAHRVADLARQVAGGEPTPEQKLDALVRYLDRNYVYSLSAPAVPRGEDAADYFLFRLKRGRCDLFATALAMMARAVDIPTRLATGFLEGKYDDVSGDYLLRESDSHAWVEAYLPSSAGAQVYPPLEGVPPASGRWITVDASPGAQEAAGGGPKGWRLAWLRVRFFWQDHPWLAAGMVLALVRSFLLAFAAIGRRRRAPDRPPAPGRDAHTHVVRAYWQFLSLLRRRGLPRRSSQTPLEFLASLGRSSPPAPLGPLSVTLSGAKGLPAPLPQAALPPAAALTEVFVTVRYGPRPATGEQAAAAKGALDDLRAALRTGLPASGGRTPRSTSG